MALCGSVWGIWIKAVRAGSAAPAPGTPARMATGRTAVKILHRQFMANLPWTVYRPLAMSEIATTAPGRPVNVRNHSHERQPATVTKVTQYRRKGSRPE
jgi:hypothetical protein